MSATARFLWTAAEGLVQLDDFVRGNAIELAGLAQLFDSGKRGPGIAKVRLEEDEASGVAECRTRRWRLGMKAKAPQVKPSYLSFMEESLRSGTDLGTLLCALSDLHCRIGRIREQAHLDTAIWVPPEASNAGARPLVELPWPNSLLAGSGGEALGYREVKPCPSPCRLKVFQRSTTKFWVRRRDLMRVKTLIVRHLPLLLFGKEQGCAVLPKVPEEVPMAFPRGAAGDSASVSSVYFDSPESGMPIYHARLWRQDGAGVVRVRWCVASGPL